MHKIIQFLCISVFPKFLFHLGTIISGVGNIYLVSSEMKSLHYYFKGTDQISISSELVLRYLRLPMNLFSIIELF